MTDMYKKHCDSCNAETESDCICNECIGCHNDFNECICQELYEEAEFASEMEEAKYTCSCGEPKSPKEFACDECIRDAEDGMEEAEERRRNRITEQMECDSWWE
ncbi:coil containing protein [Vibrio phage 2.275.O._10N.286.54.E11]|nr:coil containing protein [Vibrio phage 2.275.O._10N.286.54.E11]